MKDDKVTKNGKHYISLIDNNTWDPETYSDGWKLVEDVEDIESDESEASEDNI